MNKICFRSKNHCLIGISEDLLDFVKFKFEFIHLKCSRINRAGLF